MTSVSALIDTYTFWYSDRHFGDKWIPYNTMPTLEKVWDCYLSVGYWLAKERYAIAFTQQLQANNWKRELIYYRDASPDLLHKLLGGK